jgi:hypothetical protein
MRDAGQSLASHHPASSQRLLCTYGVVSPAINSRITPHFGMKLRCLHCRHISRASFTKCAYRFWPFRFPIGWWYHGDFHIVMHLRPTNTKSIVHYFLKILKMEALMVLSHLPPCPRLSSHRLRYWRGDQASEELCLHIRSNTEYLISQFHVVTRKLM